jgi:putative acetyltransferase
MERAGYNIRTLEKRDNESLAFIIRSVLKEFGANKPGTVYYDPTTDDLFGLFQQHNAVYFVAEKGGKLIGGAGVFPTPGLPDDCCELVKLYLAAEGRGTGIGKALMQHCFSAAKEMGFKQIYLETLPELHIAVGLYEKMGFKYLEHALGNSGHYACDLWMVKQL